MAWFARLDPVWQKHGRTALALAAVAFFLFSLAYLADFAVRNWEAVERLPPINAGPIAIAAVLYLLAHPFTSSTWVLGVRGMGHEIPFLQGLRIALTTQVGKYLPGNVAHYFGRAVLAKASGIALATSGIATLLEVFAALLAAAIVVSAAILIDPAPIDVIHTALAGRSALPALVGICATLGAGLFMHLAKVRARLLLAMTACLTVNFVLVGLSFLTISMAFSGQAVSPAAMIGIYAVAWAAGYLVPGAPAGLGVREAVLVAWLSPMIGAGPAIACTLLHRLISAGVDALVALAGFSWMKLHQPDQTEGWTFSK